MSTALVYSHLLTRQAIEQANIDLRDATDQEAERRLLEVAQQYGLSPHSDVPNVSVVRLLPHPKAPGCYLTQAEADEQGYTDLQWAVEQRTYTLTIRSTQ